MSTKTTDQAELTVEVREIEEALKAVWETAVRRNPMALVNFTDLHNVFERLRRLILDCLGRGLSAIETHDQAVKELLNSATLNKPIA